MEIYAVEWWLWMLLGLALLAGEILTPGGFFLFFFGVSALVVGALKLLGLTTGLTSEGLLFAALAVAGVVFFRKPLLQRFRRLSPNVQVDNIASETAWAVDEIPPHAIGKVELRGTAWNAQNDGDTAIPKAARCRIERVDGLTLHVRSL